MTTKQKYDYILGTFTLTSFIWSIMIGFMVSSIESNYQKRFDNFKQKQQIEINKNSMIDSLIINLENMKIK